MGPVLCCLDESDDALGILRVARLLAERLGGELVLVHVEPKTEIPGISSAPAGQERLRERERGHAERLLARFAHEAGLDPNVRARSTIGGAAKEIVELCKEERAGLVVLGSRGRGTLKSALLGSVSTEVAAAAPCPCVVVPPEAVAALHLAG